jgi:hypothetical protein
VVSHKNVTKVVWYILVQLRSLNNTKSKVSGAQVPLLRPSGYGGQAGVRNSACNELSRIEVGMWKIRKGGGCEHAIESDFFETLSKLK